jgi:predicted permease
MNHLQWLDSLAQDVRYAFRGMRRSPGFTAVAVTMLALGIGINAAVFTVTRAVLFSGYRGIDRSDRILFINSQKNGQYSNVSYPDFEDWRAQAKSFTGMGAVVGWATIALKDRTGYAESYIASRISANTFQILGRYPIIGRDFSSSDESPGAAPVAILSYGFWNSRYGKDPAVIGQTLPMNDGPPTTVIGVMPEGFAFPQNQALWLPLVPTPDLQRRDSRNIIWFAFGRLVDGVTIDTARSEMEVIARRLASSYPATNQGFAPQIKRFAEFNVNANATKIYGAMWGAVGCVLLIACANLANLALARALGRSREMSVRIALGAGRGRIAGQLLIESVLLSVTGGACGWGIARWGVRAYELAANPPVERWNHDLLTYAMDYRVLAYLMAISIGAGLLFGLAPALQFSRLNLQTTLKDGGRAATGGRRGKRLSGLLVTGEVALAVVLLCGAGLLIRSYLNMTTGVGVRTANTLTMLVNLPEAKYTRREAQTSFFERLTARLEAIPGVEAVSIASTLPRGFAGRRPYAVGESDLVDEQTRPTVKGIVIGPDYFRTLGAAVLSGREFTKFDGAREVPVALVNQRFASQQWPGEDPVGKRLRFFNGERPETWLTLVGVVSNIMQNDFDQHEMISPLVYVPFAQRPRGSGMWVLVHTRLPAGALVTAFRREINALDADLPISEGHYPLAERMAVDDFYANTRNQAVLYLIFAAIALMIASIGLYAVIAYSVSQRTQEIGIRTAMGATARDILALIVSEGLRQVGVGLAIGLAGAVAVTPVLKALLVGVAPADSLTLIIASATLIAAATLGCLIPARRAVLVDPVVALRHE